MSGAPPGTITEIIEELREGSSLRQALIRCRMSHTTFGLALRRDPELARVYMDVKQDAGDDAVHAALDAGDLRAAGIAMRRSDRMLPRRDWTAEADAVTKARRTRQQTEIIQQLERLEAKIEGARLKAQHRVSAPPRLVTIDDIKATGDAIDIYDLRRRGLLEPEQGPEPQGPGPPQGAASPWSCGTIVPGSRNALKAVIAQENHVGNTIQVVAFTSPGGNLGEGLDIGRYIRDRKLDTMVHGGCASACSYAFLGGVKRLAPTNSIGLHQFS